jgi:hypothetical protein
MPHTYRQLVFTTHAWERLQDRHVTPDAISQAVQSPTERVTLDGGKTKFIKTVSGRLIHVVAHWLPQEQHWLIVSVWVRGENDRVPLMWQLLTAPFKLLGWLVKQVWRQLNSKAK